MFIITHVTISAVSRRPEFHWVLREGLLLLAVVIADWSNFQNDSVFIVREFIWSH